MTALSSTLRNAYQLSRRVTRGPCYRRIASNAGTRSDSTDRSFTVEPFSADLVPELYPDAPKSRKPALKTLVRAQTHELRNLFSNHAHPYATAEKSPPRLAMLSGPRGSGKTTLLAHAVAHARSLGFIVLFIPRAADWSHGPGFFAPTCVEGADLLADGVSAVRFYDRPTQTEQLFDSLITAHGDDLKEVEAQPDLAQPDSPTSGCATLADIVAVGQEALAGLKENWTEAATRKAGDALHHTIAALCASSRPTAIVVDDFPALVGMTCMVDDRRRALHSNSVRFIAEWLGRSAIEDTAKAMRSGPLLLSVEDGYPMRDWRASRALSTQDFPLSEEIRLDASGKKWLRDFRERVGKGMDGMSLQIEATNLGSGELKAMCATLGKGGWRREDRRDERSVADRLVALAGGRASVMKRIYETR